jgi:hypothetical protein
MFKQITIVAGLIALGMISLGALDAARTAGKRLATDGVRIARLDGAEPDLPRPLAELPSLGKASWSGSGR